MDNLLLAENKSSGIPSQEVILEIQKDIQNYNRRERKVWRELNCSAPQNGLSILPLTVRQGHREKGGKRPRKKVKCPKDFSDRGYLNSLS